MFFLAEGLGFSHSDLMDMEHDERVEWVGLLARHRKKVKKLTDDAAAKAKKGRR